LALTVGELVAYARLDRSGWRRGVDDSKDDLQGLQRDAEHSLGDMRARFEREGEAAGRGLGDGIDEAHPHLTRLDDHLRSVSTRLLSLAGIAAKGAGLAILGTAAAGAASQTLGLVAAILPAAGAIGLLPAVAVSGAAALSVLKLATSGLGDAMKAAGGDDAAKFEEALKRLSPAARALALEVRALHPALDGLRRAVQESVFRGMAGEVRALAATWLPILHDRLVGIGLAWGVAFRNTLAAARSGVVVRGISAALDATHTSLAVLNDSVGSMVRGFGALVGAAAPFLERAGIWVGRLVAEFGAWLEQAGRTGHLTEILQMATSVLRDLGGIALQVGGIFQAVMSSAAAVGGGLLGNLRQALEAVNRFLSSAEGKTALRDFFASTSGVLRALLPTLMILARAFGSVLAPAISQVAAVLAPVLQVVATQLVAAVTKLAPALPQLAKAFGDLLVAVAPLLPAVAAIIVPLAGPLATAISKLAPLISALLIPVLVKLGITSLVTGLQLGEGLTAAMGPIGLVIAAVVGLAVLIVQHWDTIKRVTLQVWGAVRDFVVGAARGVLAWLRSNWPLLLAILTGPIGLAVLAIVRHWDQIKAAAAAVVGAVGGFFARVGQVVAGFVAELGRILARVGEIITFPFRLGLALLLAVMFAGWNAIKAPVLEALGFISGLISAAWASFTAMIRANLNLALGVVRAVWDTIRAVVSVAVAAITGVVRAGWNALAGVVRAVSGAISGAARAVWNAALAAVRSALAPLAGVVRSAWNGAVAAVRSFAGTVASAARNVFNQMLAPIGDIAGRLVSAGADLVRGFIRGVLSMGSALYNAVLGFIRSNVPGPILKVLGISSPSKLLAQYGRYAGQGLAVGLLATRRQVSDAAGVLARAALPPPMGWPGSATGTAGGWAGGRGDTHVNVNLRAYSDRFSLSQVMTDLAYAGVH
jgi:phage-related protein